MNSCELTTSVSALANILAKNLSTEDIVLLAAILVQLGDTLATIATHNSLCESIAERK